MPPTYNLHDLGPQAQMMARNCNNERMAMNLQYVAIGSDNEEGPTISELAEKIKALKAAHSIEATPQRVRQKHSSAEEPITARIRRRTEANPVADPAIQPDANASGAGNPSPETTMTQDSSIKPEMTFQERIAMERQRKEPEPSLH
jgi:hypothetical protein